MSKINFSFKSTLLLFVFGCFVQTVFAVDVPLKSGTPGPGDVPNGYTALRSRTLKTVAVIPVSATLDNTQLGVFFSSSVGVATVSVVDQYGNVIESSTIDTNSSTELYFMIDGWESGSYTLKITYGTTSLVGDFQL